MQKIANLKYNSSDKSYFDKLFQILPIFKEIIPHIYKKFALETGFKKNPGYIKKNPPQVGFIGYFGVLLGIFVFYWRFLKFYLV